MAERSRSATRSSAYRDATDYGAGRTTARAPSLAHPDRARGATTTGARCGSRRRRSRRLEVSIAPTALAAHTTSSWTGAAKLRSPARSSTSSTRPRLARELASMLVAGSSDPGGIISARSPTTAARVARGGRHRRQRSSVWIRRETSSRRELAAADAAGSDAREPSASDALIIETFLFATVPTAESVALGALLHRRRSALAGIFFGRRPRAVGRRPGRTEKSMGARVEGKQAALSARSRASTRSGIHTG